MSSNRHQRSGGGVMAFLSSSSSSSSSASSKSSSSSSTAAGKTQNSNSGNKGGSSSNVTRGFFNSSRSRSSGSVGSDSAAGSGGKERGSCAAGDESAAHDYYGGLLEMDENDNSFPWGLIHHSELATMLKSGLGKTMVIDSRSFLEFNTSNIQQSVNVCCSKLVKRRLQQDKVHVVDLLNQTCNVVADSSCDVIVYDQCTEDPSLLTADNFVHVLLRKLSTTFNSVAFLKGGFLAFQASHSNLVENKSSRYQCSTLTSLSQPCMPVSNVGPTRILSFLYLGSQQDSMAHDVAQVNGITYILNVSKTCQRPPFIIEGHFYRIPINDNYCEKLLPYFPEAFQFLDKVREANGCVLVHCLGGVSRSATLAIAYIMKHMKMSSDEAYRYVKDKRPNISPNFNFLGQLLEYEKIVRREEAAEAARKETLNAGRTPDEDGYILDDVGRASPSVMDLHTSSPSSPGPRTANKSFSPLLDLTPPTTTTQLPNSAMDCPFPGPESVVASKGNTTPHHRHRPSLSSIPTNPSPLTEGSNFGSAPAVCQGGGDSILSLQSSQQEQQRIRVHGRQPELCPFPGPSYANPAYSQNPTPANLLPTDSLQYKDYNSDDSQIASSLSSAALRLTAKDNIRLTNPALCTDQKTATTSSSSSSSYPNMPSFHHATSPSSSVCPVTGFPSPGGDISEMDRSEPTCPNSTGLPSSLFPQGHSFSSSSTSTSSNQNVLETCSASNHSEMVEVSEVINPPPSANASDSEPPFTKLGPSKSKPSFFSAVFSGFRRRSRPPTLSLGSPVAHNKAGFSTLGEKILGPQLTPVSEASENCDLNSTESINSSVESSSSCIQHQTNKNSIMSKSVSSDCFSRVVPPPRPDRKSLSSLSSPSSESSISCRTTNESLSSGNNNPTPLPTRTRSAKLNPRNFFLSLSSPTSDLHHLSSSMPCLSTLSSPAVTSPLSINRPSLLQSPGDSNNKRKSGIQSHHFNSPDKLARTDDHHHLSSATTTCSKSGHVASTSGSGGGKVRQRPSIKKPTFLTLSSPTTAMARLNFSSPSNPSKEFHHALIATSAGEGQGKIGTETKTKTHLHENKRSSAGQIARRNTEKSDHSSLTESNLSLFTSSLSSTLSSSSSGAMSRSSISCSSSSGSAALDLSSSSVSSSYLSDGGGRASSSSSSSKYSSSVLSSSTSSSSSSSKNYQSLSKFPTTSLDKLSFTPCSVRDIVQDLKDRDNSMMSKSEDQCSSFLTDSHASSSALDSPMSISSGSSNPSSTLSPVETGAAPPFPSSVTPLRSDSIDEEPSSSSLGLLHHVPMEHQQHVDDSNSITDSGIHSIISQQAIPTSPLDSSAAVTPDSMLSPSSSLPQSSISPVIPSLTSPCDSMCSSIEPLSPMSLDDCCILSNSPICSPSDGGGGKTLLSQQTFSSLTFNTATSSSCQNANYSPIMSSVISPISPISSTSSLAVSSSSSSLTLSSSTSNAAHTSSKVVLRRDKNRRVLDRPNSIAFSSYPTCDLISKATDNNNSSPSATNSARPGHHDDISSPISSSNHARYSRSSLSPDIPSSYHHGRTSWACYSEREVYRQITAAMESAMLRTHAYLPHDSSSSSNCGGRISQHTGASRKARSLDNIIDSGEEDPSGLFVKGSSSVNSNNNDGSNKVHNDSVSNSHFRGKYLQEKTMLFEPYHCGRRSGSEPYHSSSSLSSNGSHGSIHSSLEIIQLPR